MDAVAVKRGAAGLYRHKLDDLTLYSMGRMFETARTHELYSLSPPLPYLHKESRKLWLSAAHDTHFEEMADAHKFTQKSKNSRNPGL